eukprot:GHRR01031304.1.p1 GENE.GHRR01031304.1~~GHRR01031304.1.p1  ORF type:complete len:250 (+),score=68.68 GHRR01031304.1:450-1199(+)
MRVAMTLHTTDISYVYFAGYGCNPETAAICCIGFSNVTCPACPPGYGIPSKLWGCQGELYRLTNSTGSQRLLDWSYTGYMAGEMAIPILPVVTNVQDFGAMGDGITDDTQAFLDAINAVGRQGTILIPEGRYIITEQLNIPNRVVLRGKSPSSTRLVFPKSLSEIYGTNKSYTYGPGFIQFNGATWYDSKAYLATVSRNAARGQSLLYVSNSSVFTPGQWVRLVLSSPAAGGMVTDLMCGLMQETADYK